MSNLTWEQQKALNEQEETDAYKGLMEVFQKVSQINTNWKLIPSITDPLRKFHGEVEINGVKVKLGLRKTQHQYDYQAGRRPESRWVALSVPMLMEKYRYDRANRTKWCTHYKWTPTTKGIVKKVLSEAISLATLAKAEVDADIVRKKKEKEKQKQAQEFRKFYLKLSHWLH